MDHENQTIDMSARVAVLQTQVQYLTETVTDTRTYARRVADRVHSIQIGETGVKQDLTVLHQDVARATTEIDCLDHAVKALQKHQQMLKSMAFGMLMIVTALGWLVGGHIKRSILAALGIA